MNYWQECIETAFEDMGIKATSQQMKEVADYVEGAHENYSMAHGYDCIGSPSESQTQQELRTLKQKIADKKQWVLSTKICPDCVDGFQTDGWGRNHSCDMCRGKGRR